MDKYQVLNPLTPEEYNDLKENIRKTGTIYTPIIIDENKNIIDGYHRQRIYEELTAEGLSVGITKHALVGLAEEQKLQIAFEVNAIRRHMTPEQITEARTQVGRRKAAKESLKQSPQMADNWHAKQAGISDKTIRGIRQDMESASEIPKLDKLTGADGKQYPRQIERKPIAVPGADENTVSVAKEFTAIATPEFVNAAAEGKIPLKDAAALASFISPADQTEAARRVESGEAISIMEGLDQAKEARRGARPVLEGYQETSRDREETLINNTHKAFYHICEKVHYLDTDYSNTARCLLAAGNERGDLIDEINECIERFQGIKAALSKTNAELLRRVK